jgi:Ca-activated chloride channel homolog
LSAELDRWSVALAGVVALAAAGEGETPKDPYRAYAEGQYRQALEAFVDAQVARPEDPVVHLNLGSTYYKLEDFQAAEREYGKAARAESGPLRAEALYNLGNAAYRQGRLEEAIERYRAALDLIPDDEDAKYNLELVLRELERRRREAQQPPPQEQDQQEQDQQEQQQDQPEQAPQEQDQQQDQQSQSEASPPRDSDGDGLPDQVERRGSNPTDPDNPDTDGDGRLDGEEDRNANGQVDPGESDPNVPDEPDPAQMSPEQAQRYLQALEERRPEGERARGRVRRLEKDW